MGTFIGFILAVLFLTSCASKNVSHSDVDILDDRYYDVAGGSGEAGLSFLEDFNRGMFDVNDWLYKNCLNPAYEFYVVVVANDIRTVVGNFLNNLRAPAQFLNCILQGRFERAGKRVVELLGNSTVGVFGFGRPVDFGIPDEDFGQTLRVYGFGGENDVFLILPLLGPTTLIDLAGLIIGGAIDPFRNAVGTDVFYNTTALGIIDNWPEIYGPYESIGKISVNHYSALKDSYLQKRAKDSND